MAASGFANGDWYDTPLYYDIVFDEDTRREGAFLEQVHQRFGGTRGRTCLEPACGSGRLVAELAARGWRVTGFDLSPAMLEFAGRRLRDRQQKARLTEGRMEDFSFTQRFDLAHCLVSTFKYLPTEREAEAHLRCVHDHLKPGGLYVLGFHLTDYSVEKRSRERWVGERGGVHVTCNIQSWPPDRRRRRERVRSRLVVREDGGVRRQETSWWFRTYDAAQFRRLLKKVPGLELVANYDFWYELASPRDFDDRQSDNVVILRRRE